MESYMKLKVLMFLAVLPLASCYWGDGPWHHHHDHDRFRSDSGAHAVVAESVSSAGRVGVAGSGTIVAAGAQPASSSP
jgi:hypothetical protein